MRVSLSAGVRNSLADALRAAIDSGGGPATLRFYGNQPVEEEELLGIATFSFPCGDDALGGALVFDPIEEEPSAPLDGTITLARVYTSDGKAVFDCDVSGPGGGGVLEINSTRISAGGPIRVSTFSIVIPAG